MLRPHLNSPPPIARFGAIVHAYHWLYGSPVIIVLVGLPLRFGISKPGNRRLRTTSRINFLTSGVKCIQPPDINYKSAGRRKCSIRNFTLHPKKSYKPKDQSAFDETRISKLWNLRNSYYWDCLHQRLCPAGASTGTRAKTGCNASSSAAARPTPS